MLLHWVLIISALGGPLPFVSERSLDNVFDDGPGLITGVAAAREPSQQGGRSGPLSTGDLNPMHSVFFSLAPEGTEVLRVGQTALQLNTARTNSMEGDKISEGGLGLLHAETARTEVVARVGLGHGLELALAVPWFERLDPAMDGFIGWVEETSPQQAMLPVRQQYQGTPADFEMTVPGAGVVRSSAGDAGAGDPALSVKARLWSEGRFLPGVSLRAGAKFPLGAVGRGFGSGSTDLALGASVQKSVLSWLSFYGTVAGTLPFSRSPYVKPFAMASVATEVAVFPALSVVLQLNTASSPYAGTGVDVLDGRDDLVILGVHYRMQIDGQTLRMSAYATENLRLFAGPWAHSANDFTVGLGLSLEPSVRAF